MLWYVSRRQSNAVLWILIWIPLFTGCASTIDVKYPHDPGGGLLTSSEACLYDFDADGFWYVVLLHCDRVTMAYHRHEAGHHLMTLPTGDLLFYSRCSGRNEAIEIMGKTFSLKDGLVFLVTVTTAQTRVAQLPARARRFKGNDPAARADALAGLLANSSVRSFLSEDAQARILNDEQKQRKTQNENAKS